VQSALLRAGFKALPNAGATTPTLSSEQAAELLATWSDVSTFEVIANTERARHAYRVARSRSHPDAGGSNEKFTLVQEAARIIGARHGVTL
jgi:hypothetical protein